MDSSINLSKKNVLVTGSSQGIGASIARIMGVCGANVIINYYNNRKAAEDLRDELIRRYGVNSYVYQADISDEKAVLEMFQFIDETVGSIDVLVNNAGCESIDHAVYLELNEWDKVFNVNLRGAFLCSQQAGRRMIEQGKGVIINISSIHDKVPRKGLVHYCCAKAGLNMMTKCLALELASNNIRVVAVSPGAIETDMNRNEIEKFGREKFNEWIPLGRVGFADEVAWTCAFIASDKAAYLTATEIYIDGGYKEHTIRYDPRGK